MRAFPFFGEYDQVDLLKLVGLEAVLRRCQTIEYHREKRGRMPRTKIMICRAWRERRVPASLARTASPAGR